MPIHEEFITKKGFEKLHQELKDLKYKKRLEIVERLRAALAFGDISENAEYTEAKEAQAFVEGRIAEIENILRSAMLVGENFNKSLALAAIGCEVELLGSRHKRIFTIVGKNEGNPLQGEISLDSPLGQAVLGRGVGDRIKVSTPLGSKIYTITRIT